MEKVHVTECLCPNNHVILAMTWREPKYTPDSAIAYVQETVEAMLKGPPPRPWCSICKSYKFHYADRVTEAEGVVEAMAPVIEDALAKQQLRRVQGTPSPDTGWN